MNYWRTLENEALNLWVPYVTLGVTYSLAGSEIGGRKSPPGGTLN
jgi:hypothetical protein